MLAFFNIAEKPEPNFELPCGAFQNVDLDFNLKIEELNGGYQLIDPTGAVRRLFPLSEAEWYIEDFPVTLIINNKNQLEIGEGNLISRWTESGLVFIRYFSR